MVKKIIMKMTAIVEDKINETQLNCLPWKNNGRYSILFNRNKKYFQAQPHVEVIHLSGKTFVAVEIQYLSKMTLDNEEFCVFY